MRQVSAVLSRRSAVLRLATGLVGGVWLALLIQTRHNAPWWVAILGITAALGYPWVYAVRFLTGLGRLLGGERRPTQAAGLIALALGVSLAGLLLWRVGPGSRLGGGLAAVLAALIVLVSGAWACLLTYRHTRDARFLPLRYLPDAALILALGAALLAFFSHDPVGTTSVAGLLLPAGAWAAVRTWRAMNASRRLPVRAAADIVLSLLLGTSTVLFLVWLANLLDLPRAEVVALRAVLARVGRALDLPWWIWSALYAVLAAGAVVFALWPALLSGLPRAARRLPLARSVNTGRRVLTGVHIGLMLAVLIAVAAPPAVAATLHGPLREKYTLSLREQLEAEGAQAAYQEIQRQFTTTSPQRQAHPPLSDVLNKIHDTSPPTAGTDRATAVERDLAARVGRLQASTLRPEGPDVLSTGPADGLGSYEPPVAGPRDLRDRVDRLSQQQRTTDRAHRIAEQAAELAATAVASTLPGLRLGHNETIEVVREYLQGLIEGSPLQKVFYSWVRRGATRTDSRPAGPNSDGPNSDGPDPDGPNSGGSGGPDSGGGGGSGDSSAGAEAVPPPAQQIVVPDPVRLHLAALAALTSRLATARLAGPILGDDLRTRLDAEPDAAAAVDLTNEGRYIDEGGSGPCDGCPRPLRPGEEPDLLPGEHGVPEPHEVPHIPVR
jgi:hypothetical protein